MEKKNVSINCKDVFMSLVVLLYRKEIFDQDASLNNFFVLFMNYSL